LFALNIRGCIRQCQETGCVGPKCFPQCTFSSDGELVGRPWYMQEPLYLQWKKWDCQSDCRYHCMLDREKANELLNLGPVKYHGKWPFKRIYGMQVCSHRSYSLYAFIWCLFCVHRTYAVLFKFCYTIAPLLLLFRIHCTKLSITKKYRFVQIPLCGWAIASI
jgi:hypothetical protein